MKTGGEGRGRGLPGMQTAGQIQLKGLLPFAQTHMVGYSSTGRTASSGKATRGFVRGGLLNQDEMVGRAGQTVGPVAGPGYQTRVPPSLDRSPILAARPKQIVPIGRRRGGGGPDGAGSSPFDLTSPAEVIRSAGVWCHRHSSIGTTTT